MWIMYYNLSFSRSCILLSYLNAVNSERMEAVAICWHSSLYRSALADYFSRGRGGSKEYTAHRDGSGGGSVEGNMKCGGQDNGRAIV